MLVGNGRKAVVIVTALLLSACANKRELTPVKPASLPPAPYGSDTRPSADQLLKAPPQAKPDRSVELRTRSEEREDDPFDLPPPE